MGASSPIELAAEIAAAFVSDNPPIAPIHSNKK
jgi:hypothetical protein